MNSISHLCHVNHPRANISDWFILLKLMETIRDSGCVSHQTACHTCNIHHRLISKVLLKYAEAVVENLKDSGNAKHACSLPPVLSEFWPEKKVTDVIFYIDMKPDAVHVWAKVNMLCCTNCSHIDLVCNSQRRQYKLHWLHRCLLNLTASVPC